MDIQTLETLALLSLPFILTVWLADALYVDRKTPTARRLRRFKRRERIRRRLHNRQRRADRRIARRWDREQRAFWRSVNRTDRRLPF